MDEIWKTLKAIEEWRPNEDPSLELHPYSLLLLTQKGFVVPNDEVGKYELTAKGYELHAHMNIIADMLD